MKRVLLPIVLAAAAFTTPALAQDLPTPRPMETEGPAQASPPPADTPPAGETMQVPPSHRGRVMGLLEGGYGFASLYGVSGHGVDAGGFLGADLGSWDIGAQLDIVPGRTEGGLRTLTVGLGPQVDVHLGRLRLGAGGRFGIFEVARATREASMTVGLAGLYGRVSFDVATFDDGNTALFLIARGGTDVGPSAPLFTSSLGAGVRF
jgi:hypothetical protein